MRVNFTVVKWRRATPYSHDEKDIFINGDKYDSVNEQFYNAYRHGV